MLAFTTVHFIGKLKRKNQRIYIESATGNIGQTDLRLGDLRVGSCVFHSFTFPRNCAARKRSKHKVSCVAGGLN